MRTKKLHRWAAALVTVTAMMAVGCEEEGEVGVGLPEEEQGATAVAPRDEAVAQPERGERAAATEDVETTEATRLGALQIERELPEEIFANQPFQYTLIVTNTSEMTLHDIQLREISQGGQMQIVSQQQMQGMQNMQQAQQGQQPQGQQQAGQQGQQQAPQLQPQDQQAQQQGQQGQQQQTPQLQPQDQQAQQQQGQQAPQLQPQQGQQQQAQQQQDYQIYASPGAGQQQRPGEAMAHIQVLQPGESQRVQMTAVPQAEGQAQVCLLADYKMAECATIEVVKPELVLRRMVVDEDGNAVSRAYACEELFLVYEVVNTGTGETGEITVTEQLQGLQTADGQNQIQVQLESLAAGESAQTDRIPLNIEQSTTFGGTAMARTERLQAQAGGTTQVQIMKPSIEMQIDGPAQQYLGRVTQYSVSVTNTSQYPAPETRVALDLPDNIDRLSVSSQQIEREGNTFILGTLDPNETRTFNIAFEASEPGQLVIAGQAEAYCAEASQSRVQTMVQGVPALQIQAVDAQDPLQVGQQTQYEIVVLNEGTAADTSIQLQGQLEQGLEFVGGEGATQVQGQGNQIRFGPIQSLEPGQEARWLVTVRAVAPQRSRLELELQSDALSRPLRVSEPTNVY